MRKIVVIVIFLAAPVFLFSREGAARKEYRHEVLKFSIFYPASWLVPSADDYYRSLERARLSDAEFQEMLVRNARVPFFAVTKYPEPHPDVNPSIKINTRPYGNLKGQGLDVLLSAILGQLKNVFKDYTVVREPAAVKVNGIPAWYAMIRYTMVVDDGAEFPVTSEIWLIDRGDYFYIIGAGRRQDEKKEIIGEIGAIINSITIGK